MHRTIMKQTFFFNGITLGKMSDTTSIWHDVVLWGHAAIAVTEFSESLLKKWKIFYFYLPYFSLQENNFY